MTVRSEPCAPVVCVVAGVPGVPIRHLRIAFRDCICCSCFGTCVISSTRRAAIGGLRGTRDGLQHPASPCSAEPSRLVEFPSVHRSRRDPRLSTRPHLCEAAPPRRSPEPELRRRGTPHMEQLYTRAREARREGRRGSSIETSGIRSSRMLERSRARQDAEAHRGWPEAPVSPTRRPSHRAPHDHEKKKSLPHIAVRQASPKKIRRRPTLPGSFPPSTIGAIRLDFSVRNGKRYDPDATTTGNCQGDRGRSLEVEPSNPHHGCWLLFQADWYL